MKIDVRTVGPFQENSYLVVDEATNRAVLVDPGDEGAVLVDMVRQSGAVLEAIWLTHAHIDHIGGIAEVRRHYDVPVHLHPADLPYYERLSARAAEMYGVAYEQPDGPHAELVDGEFAAWMKGYEFSLSGPIYAGTNEIQRNVVAERVLGLPRK